MPKNSLPQTLLENQARLQAQGKKLLEETELKKILESYGRVETGGSYVYGLMTHPDLDLGVISETISKERYGTLVGALASLASVRKLKTSDRVNHTQDMKKAIRGYWIGLEMDFEHEIWNIDIWYQKPQWQNDRTAEWKEKLDALSDTQHVAILIIKEELRAQGRYGVGKQYVGVDVYRAVIEHDVKTTKELDTLQKS
jgi:hypothetical protein